MLRYPDTPRGSGRLAQALGVMLSARNLLIVTGTLLLVLLFFAITRIDRWPTLLLLTVCALLSIDSLLGLSFLGTRYLKLSIWAYGTFHRQATFLSLILYFCLALGLVFVPDR